MNRKQYKRYHSPVIAAEREKVEAELSAMNPLEPEVRHFLSFEGFAELYLRMRDLYPTQLEAYERLEDFYITITGKRRYSEFSSFRRVLNRTPGPPDRLPGIRGDTPGLAEPVSGHRDGTPALPAGIHHRGQQRVHSECGGCSYRRHL